jgi:hypothetical protein
MISIYEGSILKFKMDMGEYMTSTYLLRPVLNY